MDECPHTSVLMAFALGEEIEPDLAADVAVHIEDCAECARLYEEMAIPPAEVDAPDEGSECPSAAELEAYHAGELTRDEDARVIGHLSAGCEPCTEAVLKLSEGHPD